jgi:cell volume regulation protein A
VFLSAGEIGDRIAVMIRNWRRPAEQKAESVPIDTGAPAPDAQKAAGEG